jgi:lipopolysaccharide transport protein LptA
MDFLKRSGVLIFILFVIGLFYWALYVPKEDATKTIQTTLEKQKKRLDLYFKEVTFQESEGAVKYWEIKAKTSSLNKDTGVAELKEAHGTFFDQGRPTLRFVTPFAIWNMKNKEIQMTDVLGYDIRSELGVQRFLAEARNQDVSTFSLPARYRGRGSGYFFKAKELEWKLARQKLVCGGGIWLVKGDLIGTGKELEADVAMQKVRLTGEPNVTINGHRPVNVKAREFQVDSPADIITALGEVLITSDEMVIKTDKVDYLQTKGLINIPGSVAITYKDTQAKSNRAVYDLTRQKIEMTDHTKLVRGKSTLSGQRILVSLKDNSFKIIGDTKVVIPQTELE